MAAALTSYYVAYGDWRKMFTGIDEIAKVTADDVQRVAKQYLIPDARTVAWIVPPLRRRPPRRRRNENADCLCRFYSASLALAQTEVHRGPVNLPSYKDLKFPPLPPLEIPKPVEFTLSNGIKVFPARGSRTAAGVGRRADPHRQSFRSRRQTRSRAAHRRSFTLGRNESRRPAIRSMKSWRTWPLRWKARSARAADRFPSIA